MDILSFDKLDTDIINELQIEVINDPFGLSAKTLYSNIVGTLKTSSTIQTSQIFEVDIAIIEGIKEANKSFLLNA